MIKSFRFLWRYMKEYYVRLIVTGILVCLSSVVVLIAPNIFGSIIDDIGLYKADMNLLIMPLSIVLLSYVGRAIFIYVYRYNTELVSQNVMLKIREDMYKNLGKLDFHFYDQNRTGDLMTKMTADVDMVRHFVAYTMSEMIRLAIMFICAAVYLLVLNAKLALILLTLIPFIAFISYKLQKKAHPQFMETRRAFSFLNTMVEENIAGNRVVKAFASEDYEMEKFEVGNLRFKKSQLDLANIWATYIPPLDMIASLFMVFLILFGGIMAIGGMGSGISVGDILQFSMLLWTLEIPTRQAGWLVSEATQCVTSIERIREILDAKPDIENTKNFIVKDRLQGKIEFRNVNFSYGEDRILSDINFVVKPGQTIALVGPTGSGKSTLINLICRFYDATDGEILLDDTDIKSIDLKTLRHSIATALQDIFLFSDTIEENIAYGNPDISHEQIIRVAKIADADNFIHNLPDDYETIIGERGVGLSGGQKQRIALARALVNDPSVLILDDTTSSVDMQTEHEIHKMLGEYFNGRTTIIIAHRISAVRHADQIFVLSDGQIIEHGTHEELTRRPREEAYYRSVYENQYGDFDNFYKGGDNNGEK